MGSVEQSEAVLVRKLLDAEMYNSALLIAEHLYNHECSEANTEYLIEALYRNGFDTLLVRLVAENPATLRKFNIGKMYLEVMFRLKRAISEEEKETIIGSDCQKPVRETEYRAIAGNSIISLKIALTTEDIKLKSDFLLQSYLLDTENIEGIFFLLDFEMIDEETVIKQLSNNPYKRLFTEVFFGEIDISRVCYHAWSINRKIIFLANTKYYNRLFLYSLVFQDTYYAYKILGVYYLFDGNNSEAKRCFHHICKSNGSYSDYYFLGACYSELRECENAIQAFTKSNNVNENWKACLCLASEYHRMNNFELANKEFQRVYSFNRNKFVVTRYLAFLVQYEKYEKARLVLDVFYASKNYDLRDIDLVCRINVIYIFLSFYIHDLPVGDGHFVGLDRDLDGLIVMALYFHMNGESEKSLDYITKASLKAKDMHMIDQILEIIIQKDRMSIWDYMGEVFCNMDLKIQGKIIV